MWPYASSVHNVVSDMRKIHTDYWVVDSNRHSMNALKNGRVTQRAPAILSKWECNYPCLDRSFTQNQGQKSPLAFPSGSWATCPWCGKVPCTLSWPEVLGSSHFHSACMWMGDMLGNVVSRKCVVLWTVGKASSSMNKLTVTPWTWNDDSGVGDIVSG